PGIGRSDGKEFHRRPRLLPQNLQAEEDGRQQPSLPLEPAPGEIQTGGLRPDRSLRGDRPLVRRPAEGTGERREEVSRRNSRREEGSARDRPPPQSSRDRQPRRLRSLAQSAGTPGLQGQRDL